MSDYKPTGMSPSLAFIDLSRPSSKTFTPVYHLLIPPFLNPCIPINHLSSSTENDGLRKGGQPDQRVGTGEVANGNVDPHDAGN